jgi:hypothetical protein
VPRPVITAGCATNSVPGCRRHAKEKSRLLRVIIRSTLSTKSTKEITMVNTLAASTLSTPVWLYIVTRSGGLWSSPVSNTSSYPQVLLRHLLVHLL